MRRPILGPVVSRARAQLAAMRRQQFANDPRIVAAHDPLRAVPRGTFTLDDFSYDASGLSHHHFGNCSVPSKGVA